MRPEIFIGSSVEGLKYTEDIKKHLESIGEFKVWTNAFTLNRSGLESLIRSAKLSDYAILIATADDLLRRRNEDEIVARDNVIFEFGLFAGIVGIDRVFLLAERDIKLPSDLEGITLSKFSNNDEDFNSLEKMCREIAKHIIKEQETSKLGMLPSTALAIGYYQSFIKPLCDQITSSKSISKEGKIAKVSKFELIIVIPKQLDNNGVMDFKSQYNQIHDLDSAQTIALNQPQRGFPFHFKVEPEENETFGKLRIFDVPTTLNTLVESIKLFLPTEKTGYNEERFHLEKRELHNFSKVLRYFIEGNSLTRNKVIVSDEEVI